MSVGEQIHDERPRSPTSSKVPTIGRFNVRKNTSVTVRNMLPAKATPATTYNNRDKLVTNALSVFTFFLAVRPLGHERGRQ